MICRPKRSGRDRYTYVRAYVRRYKMRKPKIVARYHISVSRYHYILLVADRLLARLSVVN